MSSTESKNSKQIKKNPIKDRENVKRSRKRQRGCIVKKEDVDLRDYDNIVKRLDSFNDICRKHVDSTYRMISSRHLNESLLKTNHDDEVINALVLVLECKSMFHEQFEQPNKLFDFTSTLSSLVSLPSAFDIPWIISCKISEFIVLKLLDNRGDCNPSSVFMGKLIRNSIIDIQCFLRETVLIWISEKRKILQEQELYNINHLQNDDGANDSSKHPMLSPRKLSGTKEQMTEKSSRDWMTKLMSVLLKLVLNTSFVAATDDCSPSIKMVKSSSSVKPHAVVSSFQTRTQFNTEKEVILYENHRVVLTLISTIVSLANEMDKQLLETFMNDIFVNWDVKMNKILLWVQLANDLVPFLRQQDWDCIIREIQTATRDRPLEFSCYNDLPKLIESLFSLYSHRMQTTVVSSNAKLVGKNRSSLLRFQKLILEIMIIVSDDYDQYSKVEYTVQGCLSRMSHSMIQQWLCGIQALISLNNHDHFLMTYQHIPIWILLNMLLIVNQSSFLSGSQMISVLLEEIVDGTMSENEKVRDDIPSMCWELFRDLISLEEGISITLPKHKKKKIMSSELGERSIKAVFEGAIYVGKGVFEKSDGKPLHILTQIGSLVFNFLFLGQSSIVEDKSRKILVQKRAEALYLFASRILKKVDNPYDSVDIILTIACVVSVHLEIPSIRNHVVHDIKENLSNIILFTQNITTSTFVYDVIFSILIRSMENLNRFRSYSSELCQLGDVLHQQMPIQTFFDLTKSLRCLKPMRSVIFHASTNRVKMWINTENTNVVTVSDTSSRNMLDSFKCGLLGLLFLVWSSPWAEYETQAWAIVYDIIVEGCSFGNVGIRSWFFCEIKKLAQSHPTEYDVMKHFLKACVIRILSFVEKKHESERVAFEKAFECYESGIHEAESFRYQSEDITGLFDLIFCLINCLSYENEELQSLVNSCRGILLSLIPDSLGSNGYENDDNDIIVLLPSSKSFENLAVMASFQCFALSLVDNNVLESANWATPVQLFRFRDLFLKTELHEIKSVTSERVFPPWCRSGESLCRSSPKSQIDFVQMGLLDLLSEILVPSSLAMNQNELAESSENRCLAWKLISVFRKKVEFTMQHSSDIDPKATESFLKRKTLSVRLLQLFVPEIRYCVAERRDFREVKMIVSTSLELCKNINLARDIDTCTVSNILPDLQSMWSIYMCLCTESAAVGFISYLESQACVADEPSLFGILLATPQDVDKCVRYVRLTVVKSVWGLLRSYRELNELGLLVAQDEIFVNNDCLIILLSNILCTLSLDIRKGLEGESGGMTLDIVDAIIDCLEDCAVLLEINVTHNSQRSHMKTALESSIKTGETCRDILCSFDIGQSSLYEKTLKLCANTFPSIGKVFCIQLCIAGSSEIAKKHYRTFRSVLTIFNDAISILKIRAEHDPERPWQDCMVRSEAIEDYGNMRKSRPFGKERGALVGHSRQSSMLKRLRISCEATLEITFSCVLVSFAKIWERRFPSYRESQKFNKNSVLQFYFCVRREELFDTLRTVCFILQGPSLERSAVDAEKSVKIHAMTLSVGVKNSLLSLLDIVATVLVDAVKAIASSLRTSDTTNSMVMDQVASVDALSCILAWLSQKNDDSDFIIAAQKWLLEEIREQNLATSDIVVPQLCFFRRIPKIKLKIEELEIHSKRLWQILKSSSLCPASKGNPLLMLIDKFVGSGKVKGGIFLRNLGSKVTFMKMYKNMFFANVEFTIDRNQGKRFGADEGEIPCRKKREPVVQSRNEVISKWLRLDQEELTSGSLDDDTLHRDAFADLEDFIVEG